MIVASSNLVLSESGLTADHPIVGWQNLVTVDNIVADTEDANYPATNLANPATHLRWKAATSALQEIEFTPDSAETIDYVGIARHNLSSQQIPITILTHDGGSPDVDTVLVDEVILPDDGPAIFRFDPGAYPNIKIELGAGLAPAEIGVVFIGKLLVMPVTLWQGMGSPIHQLNSTITNGMSEAGDFLGRIETMRRMEAKVPWSLIRPDYYREHIHDFIKVCRTRPFFFGWRPQTYPYESAYCAMINNPMPVNESPHGLIAMSWEMTGVIAA